MWLGSKKVGDIWIGYIKCDECKVQIVLNHYYQIEVDLEQSDYCSWGCLIKGISKLLYDDFAGKEIKTSQEYTVKYLTNVKK